MEKSKKYSHAIDVAFEVETDNEEPTIQEMLSGMAKRLAYLIENKAEAGEAFDVYDTYESEDEYS